MRTFTLILCLMVVTGCATIVNGERQQVFFRGGPEAGVTKVFTPDGTFDVENGAGAFMMTRSKSDIPIKVACPNGAGTKNGIIETRFDWAWGGAGNILNYGIGWFVDPFTSDSYVIKDVSLASFCSGSVPAANAH